MMMMMMKWFNSKTSCASQSIKLLITNAFISSQFSYCPLLWMCHTRSIENKINKICERASRIIYNNDVSAFDDVAKSKSVNAHYSNIQILATEIGL